MHNFAPFDEQGGVGDFLCQGVLEGVFDIGKCGAFVDEFTRL
jgi:hypothetical protein